MAASMTQQGPADLYVELLKKSVGNYIYDDDMDLMLGEKIFGHDGKLRTKEPVECDPESRYIGKIWPTKAHTMVGRPRLDNIQRCVETVLKERVPGDLIETGVWRGGVSILMRGILKAHGVTDRCIWVADSFAGLPVGDRGLYPKESEIEFFRFEELAVSLEEVKRNFEAYDLLDDQVRFLKGWFRESLPGAPIERLAVMHLDGDMYESTMDALTNLYGKLSRGGFVIVDDFNAVDACNEAVADFRREHDITEKLHVLPVYGALWRKTN